MQNQGVLIEAGKSAIVKGSKSFSLASFFFSQEQKHAAWLLYSWCRFVDDEIDKAATIEAAKLKLIEVRDRTNAALRDPSIESGPYRSLGLLAQQYNVPWKYPLDLIRGMEMDVDAAKIQDEEQLLDYCYCVAGTVGLMMCYVMGVKSEKAYSHALSMGQAMQLTNIARDVAEDLNINRIYFPRTWLNEVHLSEENFKDNKSQWPLLVERLLTKADSSYENGFAGLRFLNFRAALAVIIAAFVYRDIGAKIRRSIPQSFEKRTYTTTAKKILLLILATSTLCWLRIKESFESPVRQAQPKED